LAESNSPRGFSLFLRLTRVSVLYLHCGTFPSVATRSSFVGSVSHRCDLLVIQDTPWLDGKHVGKHKKGLWRLSSLISRALVPSFVTVFGSVTDGLDVIDKIERIGSQSGKTAKPVVIKDCGEL
jgi:cyclophilin family peptidyl-prolyl cis-trans isomerase